MNSHEKSQKRTQRFRHDFRQDFPKLGVIGIIMIDRQLLQPAIRGFSLFRLRIIGWAACSISLGAVTATARAADIVEIAQAFSDGGGYEWKGTGAPEEIRFKGERVLDKGKHTYCSGFTFAVAMKAAAERGLLTEKSVADVRKFQKRWYGATSESAETQCVLAVQVLGIGEPVATEKAEPGDFLQLWRTNGSGHSVVFLGWVKESGELVGVKYRSSQTSTNGIGDRVEYFAGVPGKKGLIDPKRMHFCRLNKAR
jgi:hypothetical protein